MVKAIIFDLDDTLLWDNKSVKTAFENTCEYARGKYGVDPITLEEMVREQARALYASYSTYSYTQMIGINPFEALWGSFADEGEEFHRLKEIAPRYREKAWTNGLKAIEVDDPAFGAELADRFIVERSKNAFVYEDTFEVLDKLKGEYALLLLTNGSPDLQHTKLKMTPALAPYFDHIVISGAFGKGKPDPEIFEHALKLLSVQTDEALMVGDNLNTDILGASRAGLRSVWMNRQHRENNSKVKPTYEIASLQELTSILMEV